MNEENKKNEQSAAAMNLNMIAKGALELAVPIRARSQDITTLHYDFDKLTGWEYVEAMDADPGARSVFTVSKKQALCLFAAAAAKATPDVDAKDIKERISLPDAQRAVQVATLFLITSAREAGRNTYGA